MTNPVGGFTKQFILNPTVSLSIYTSGDVVGGEVEIPKFFAHPGSSAILQSIFLTDEADQDADLELLFFKNNPSATYSDNAAVPAMAADVPDLIARVSIVAADWGTIGGVATARVTNIDRPLQAAKGLTSLWMVAVTLSTPTFIAATDLRILLGVLQD